MNNREEEQATSCREEKQATSCRDTPDIKRDKSIEIWRIGTNAQKGARDDRMPVTIKRKGDEYYC